MTPLQVHWEIPTKQWSKYHHSLIVYPVEMGCAKKMLLIKPGQDHEPNLPGFLLRIRIFDLAGGLQGMKEQGQRWSEEKREARGEDSFSILELLLERKALIG